MHLKETDQSGKVVDAVLDWSPGKAPAVIALKGTSSFEPFGRLVLDEMG